MTRHAKMSPGADLLSRLGLTLEEIATAAGASVTSAHHWVKGRSRPGAAARARLEAAYAIPVASWDEACGPALPGAVQAPPVRASEGDHPVAAGGDAGDELDVDAVARELRQTIAGLLGELRAKGAAGLPPSAKARLVSSCCASLAILDKIDGAALDRRILEHAHVCEDPGRDRRCARALPGGDGGRCCGAGGHEAVRAPDPPSSPAASLARRLLAELARKKGRCPTCGAPRPAAEPSRAPAPAPEGNEP